MIASAAMATVNVRNADSETSTISALMPALVAPVPPPSSPSRSPSPPPPLPASPSGPTCRASWGLTCCARPPGCRCGGGRSAPRAAATGVPPPPSSTAPAELIGGSVASSAPASESQGGWPSRLAASGRGAGAPACTGRRRSGSGCRRRKRAAATTRGWSDVSLRRRTRDGRHKLGPGTFKAESPDVSGGSRASPWPCAGTTSVGWRADVACWADSDRGVHMASSERGRYAFRGTRRESYSRLVTIVRHHTWPQVRTQPTPPAVLLKRMSCTYKTYAARPSQGAASS